MEYTVDYFIQKFEAIPDEKWTIKEFTNAIGQCCALGHCGRRIGSPTAEGEALYQLFHENEMDGPAHINDGYSIEYQQPTPKARILAALNDIKTKQNQTI